MRASFMFTGIVEVDYMYSINYTMHYLIITIFEQQVIYYIVSEPYSLVRFIHPFYRELFIAFPLLYYT